MLVHPPPPTVANRRRPRRRLNPAARRSELLEAALNVLRERGPAEVCVEDVTRAAGAAKGTFYLYFPSWNDLLVAIRRHLLATYASDLRVRLAAVRPPDWWPAIENECVRFVDFLAGLGGVHEAVFHGPVADLPIEPEYSARTLIAGIVNAGIAAGAYRPVDVETAAALFFAVLHTTADDITQHGDRLRRIESMLDLLRAWLRPSPCARKKGKKNR